MSEIAKCPVCGETLSGHVDGVIECKDGCSFRCGGYALPRIAAAMKLANAYVSEEEKRRKGTMYRGRPAAEIKRVLEVFK